MCLDVAEYGVRSALGRVRTVVVTETMTATVKVARV